MNEATDRYSRQVLFGPIGQAGQERLAKGRVTLIGCGGLGTVVADTLVRAGVGFLRIVDRDVVEESNLQRQLLYDTADVTEGRPKAVVAQRRLSAVNPEVEVASVVEDVSAASIRGLVNDVDVIVDGTDNFETRYLINDTAISEGIPWVYGAAAGSNGMTATIIPGATPCLRCLYEEGPLSGTAPSCNTVGILASIVRIIASVQACEAIKLLCGEMAQVSRKMLMVDVWKGSYRSVDLEATRRSECPACGTGREN